MGPKDILKQLNVFAECRRYGIPLRQCPSFLFVIMGLIIIVAMLLTYYIGVHYLAPEMLIIILGITTIVLLIVGHTIVASFERIAQANRMKSEFVSIVSHQLRTPLSSLKWSLDLLRGRRLGEINKKQEEYLDIVNESNNRMIDLVNDLLNVNRIEEGRFEIKPKTFSLESLAEEVIEELRPIANKSGVVINLYKDKNIPSIYADPNRIRMAVENLIDNAIKYSKKDIKDKFINVGLKQEKDEIRFSVEDNGIGIPTALQKQVFGKFFRGDNLIKQRVEGTGLGLFIARGIIKLSGGEMDFKSKEGRGSHFWFTLPIANKLINRSR